MSADPCDNLKVIRFEGQLLPQWAQLLDGAARLCPVAEEVRRWFSGFANSSGVDDARTVMQRCLTLRNSLLQHRELVRCELRRDHDDDQASRILGAWGYALDTMIQEAQGAKTCAWILDGGEDESTRDSADGDITLRRV